MGETEPFRPEPVDESPAPERWDTVPLAEGEGKLGPLPAPATLLRLRVAQSGRPDPSLGLIPDLDLSSEGPEAPWVSRRHARIFYHDGHFYIEDLGSTNGTYLNHKRLVSGLPYALQDGDELRFGRIVAHVHIE